MSTKNHNHQVRFGMITDPYPQKLISYDCSIHTKIQLQINPDTITRRNKPRYNNT